MFGRRRGLLGCFAVMLLWAPLPTYASAPLVGTYWSPSKDGQFRIWRDHVTNTYRGQITWSRDNPKDTHNPSPHLRARHLEGIEIIHGLTRRGNKLVGGWAYHWGSGRTYRLQAWRDGEELILRVYVGFPSFGRSLRCARVDARDAVASGTEGIGDDLVPVEPALR